MEAVRRIERKVQAGFAVALVLLSVIGILSYRSVIRLREDRARVVRTHEVIGSMRLLLSIVTDAEAGLRGYTVTGQESYLVPHDDALRSLEAELQKLRTLTADDPDRQRQLGVLAGLIAERMNHVREIVALRRDLGFEAARAAIATGRGKEIQHRIRELVADMEKAEEGLLHERDVTAERSSALTRTVIVAGSVVAFGIVGLALFFIGQDFAGRARADAALREANEQLEARVLERTADLLRTNASLRESRAQFATAFESLSEGLVVSDLDGQLLHWNQAAVAMHGFSSPAEGLRQLPEFADIFELSTLGGAVLPLDQWPLSRVLRGEQLSGLEIRIRRTLSDRHRIFSYGGRLVRDEEGRAFLAVVSMSDITERKQAEAQRDELARQRQLALGAARLGWWTYDPSTRIASWDERYKEIFGVSGSQRPNEEILARLHPDDLPRVWAAVEAAMDPANPSPYAAEYRVNHPDGSVRWVEAHGVASFEGDGDQRRATGLVGTVQDITERKRAEAAIRTLNAELEQRVADRTAELEAANKELEAFSYSVSHDLRAPLRTVDGFSQALLEDFGSQLPEEGQRQVRTIREGAQRMGALIDDLLAFARLGRQSPSEPGVIDMDRLVREALEDLLPERQGRRVEIRAERLPPCNGDNALLKQVWANLLSNALKYTRKRDPAVVEIGSVVEDGATVYFVRDNGAGFDMRYAHKLFGVFQRLHRAEDFEGSGVGLAIVHRIIRRHGGRVWAEAAVDRGATFRFTLPEGAAS